MKIFLFVSSHCPHCPKAEALVKKVFPEYQKYGLEFEKIRMKTEKGKQLAAGFGIRALPTILMLDREGKESWRIVGAPSEDNFRKKLEQALGLKKSFFDKIFGGK
jgi:thioredoxin-related protein